jgi:cation transport regulator ChaC
MSREKIQKKRESNQEVISYLEDEEEMKWNRCANVKKEIRRSQGRSISLLAYIQTNEQIISFLIVTEQCLFDLAISQIRNKKRTWYEWMKLYYIC